MAPIIAVSQRKISGNVNVSYVCCRYVVRAATCDLSEGNVLNIRCQNKVKPHTIIISQITYASANTLYKRTNKTPTNVETYINIRQTLKPTSYGRILIKVTVATYFL